MRKCRPTTRLILASCLPLILLAACSSERRSGSTDDDKLSDALYSPCASDADCRGTGLLCDERRGCVECLEQADCPSNEQCRRGLCDGGDQRDGSDASTGGSSNEKLEGGGSSSKGDPDSNEGGEGGTNEDGDDSAQEDDDASDDSNGGASGKAGGDDDDDSGGTDGSDDDGGDDDGSDDDGGDDDGGDDGDSDDDVSEGTSCRLTLEAIYRDFPESHIDFGDHAVVASLGAQGAVLPQLNAEGRPELADSTQVQRAFMSTPENFLQWYQDGEHNHKVVKDLVLFDDGMGGFVNRYGANGEPFPSIEGGESYPGGATLEACEESCRTYVLNEDFNASCANYCGPQSVAVQEIENRLEVLQEALTDPELLASDAGVAPTVSEIEAEIDELTPHLAAAEAELAVCKTACEAEVDVAAATCASTCLPCPGYYAYCTGGTIVELDGTPLFFPVDDVTGPTADMDLARLPDFYGFSGWPFEEDVFADAPEHNFYFTTEIQTTVELAEGTLVELELIGDDDLWVFVNGRLALDVGGVHIPAGGTVTIDTVMGTIDSEVTAYDSSVDNGEAELISTDSATLADFNLVPGGSYPVSIFHAERQKEGSSFRLRLTGFDDGAVECPK